MEVQIPTKLLQPHRVWFPESARIKCVCSEVIVIKSTQERYGKKLCNDCDLMYEFWNNKDGSGLRFNIKGYFPFYPDGYKFVIERC